MQLIIQDWYSGYFETMVEFPPREDLSTHVLRERFIADVEDQINPNGNQCLQYTLDVMCSPQWTDQSGTLKTRVVTCGRPAETLCFKDLEKDKFLSTPFYRSKITAGLGSNRYSVFSSNDSGYDRKIYWNDGSYFGGAKARWIFRQLPNGVVEWKFIAVSNPPEDYEPDPSGQAWTSPLSWSGVRQVHWHPLRMLPEEQPIMHLPLFLQETMGEGLFPDAGGYSDTCYAATENCRVNHANMITLPVEMLNLITGKEAINLADDLLNHCSPESPGCMNLISSLYLNGRFGAKLTGIELEQFMENQLASNQWREKLQSKTLGSSAYAGLLLDSYSFSGRSQVSYDYAYRGFNYLIKRWDNASLPRLSDVWDAIPYSFVVDWAFGIGDNIERLEHNIYQTAMDISNIWESVKGSFDTQPIVTNSGIMEWACSYYCRRGRSSVSTASFDVRPSGTTKNLADLTSLLVQGNSS